MQNDSAESLVARYGAETKQCPAEICFGNGKRATQRKIHLKPKPVGSSNDKKLEAVINFVKHCCTKNVGPARVKKIHLTLGTYSSYWRASSECGPKIFNKIKSL